MAMVKSRQKSVSLVKLSKQERLQLERIQEERFQEERLKDVLVIIQNLVDREEATVKMVLDGLYDVGAINLVNKKFRFRPLNRMMKSIAAMSKPIFKIVGYIWFRKNCPQLITDWLASQVRFSD